MKKSTLYLLLAVSFILTISSCEKKTDDPDNPGEGTVELTADIVENTTLQASKTYFINTIISVFNNATLTIEPGASIQFGAYGGLEVGYGENATLIANGTANKPIRFTSSDLNPLPGAWNYIAFGPNTSSNTSLSWCIVEYAGKNSAYSPITIEDCKISMLNNTLQNNSGSSTIYVYSDDEQDGFVQFSANIMENNSGHAIRIPGDNAAKINSNNLIECDAKMGVLIETGFKLESVLLNKLTVPYVMDNIGGASVDGELMLMPGVQMLFPPASALELYMPNAKLIAMGTAAERIVFSTTMPTPEPGAWDGIRFEDEASSNSVLSYCDILYAGENDYYEGAVSIYNNQVNINNCNISFSERYGIFLMDDAELSSGSVGNIFSANAFGDMGTNE